jgi:Xaa-Pro dipeptidase
MATLTIPSEPDVVRMQRDRRARLQTVMVEQDVETLILLGNSNVSYATGARWPLGDAGRANVERPVAVVTAGDAWPHVFTPHPEEADDLDLPDDHRHGPVYLDFDEGADAFAAAFPDLAPGAGRVAIDELPGSLQRAGGSLFAGGPPASADDVVGAAKLIKSPDELGFLRIALQITEDAIATVQAALAPGVRQTDLTARFLHRVFELGADANILDPIWQVMPSRLEDGPWTTHGDIACPLLTTERELVEGDVIWVDTGVSYAGFASDFGRTWVVGREPTPQQHAQFRAWRQIIDAVLDVTKAGATGADLTAAALAASDGRRPWMPHFYLGHGLGIESAESPFVGTDLGDAYDARQVLAAGTVLVLEPLIWEEGASGYRAEEVVVITDDGFISLTDYPYDPYGD